MPRETQIAMSISNHVLPADPSPNRIENPSSTQMSGMTNRSSSGASMSLALTDRSTLRMAFCAWVIARENSAVHWPLTGFPRTCSISRRA